MMDMYSLLMGGGSGGGGGSDSSVLVVHGNAETLSLDKTWSQINTADVAIYLAGEEGVEKNRFLVTATWVENGTYGVNVFADGTVLQFTTDSESGYPVYAGEG